jgi:hypothetical protein
MAKNKTLSEWQERQKEYDIQICNALGGALGILGVLFYGAMQTGKTLDYVRNEIPYFDEETIRYAIETVAELDLSAIRGERYEG